MVRWWKPRPNAGRLEQASYRARFEPLWADLPRLLVLATLPGWGKGVWMEQCAQYLETAQPHLKITGRGTDGLGPALDAARGGSGHLLCLLDARGSGADGGFLGESRARCWRNVLGRGASWRPTRDRRATGRRLPTALAATRAGGVGARCAGSDPVREGPGVRRRRARGDP